MSGRNFVLSEKGKGVVAQIMWDLFDEKGEDATWEDLRDDLNNSEGGFHFTKDFFNHCGPLRTVRRGFKPISDAEHKEQFQRLFKGEVQEVIDFYNSRA